MGHKNLPHSLGWKYYNKGIRIMLCYHEGNKFGTAEFQKAYRSHLSAGKTIMNCFQKDQALCPTPFTNHKSLPHGS
jgi:hypothetical protein